MVRVETPLKQQVVWLMNPRYPWRNIVDRLCEIKVCNKWTWAIDNIYQGKRHVLGTSAFFSREAAERARVGAIRRIISNGYIGRCKPKIYFACKKALEGLK